MEFKCEYQRTKPRLRDGGPVICDIHFVNSSDDYISYFYETV